MTSIVPWGLLKLRGKTWLRIAPTSTSTCSHSHGVEHCQSQICQSCQCLRDTWLWQCDAPIMAIMRRVLRTYQCLFKTTRCHIECHVPCLCAGLLLWMGHIITEPFCLTSNKVLFVPKPNQSVNENRAKQITKHKAPQGDATVSWLAALCLKLPPALIMSPHAEVLLIKTGLLVFSIPSDKNVFQVVPASD